MAKIVCVVSGLTGMLNASFELMKRLMAEGHEVKCAVPWDVSEKVNRQGFEFIELPPLNFVLTLSKQNGTQSKWSEIFWRYRNFKSNRHKLLKEIFPTEYISLIKNYQPDLILLDIELPEYIIVTNRQKIPFILLSQWFSVWRRPKLPYLKLQTIPGKGRAGSDFGIWASWLRIKIQRWIQLSKKKIKTGFTDRHSLLLAFARQQNFPRKYIGENLWPGPFLINKLPVLNLVSAGLEFPHDHRSNSHYVEGMVYDQRKDLPAQTKNNYTLDDVFEYVKAKRAKLIYCSVSTMKQGDSGFLERVAEVVRSEEKWVLVISTGKLIDELTFNNRPKNVFTFSFLPQLELLSKADCSINHGGIHTINECIHFGVPMLVYSGKKADQNGCAARVLYHKVGLIGDKDQDSVAQIKEKINQVLTKDTYKKHMQELHESYLRKKRLSYLKKRFTHY